MSTQRIDIFRQVATIPAVVIALASVVHGAKVVRFYDPWPIVDEVHLTAYYPLQADIVLTRVAGTLWLQAVIPDTSWNRAVSSTSTTIGIHFTHTQNPYATYCANGVGTSCTDFDVRATLTNSDTLWIIPQPSNFGPAVISTTTPKFVYVAVWNPWSGDSALAIRVGTNSWIPLVQIPGNTGWWVAQVVDVGNLDVSVAHDVGGTGPYFTASGTNSSQPTPAIRLDSLVGKSDTLWLRFDSGQVLASGSTTEPRTLLVFNPWNGQFGVTPDASFDGGATWLRTSFAKDYCGWYEVRTYNTPSKVRISNDAGTVSADIPLSWKGDTLFLSNALGTPLVSPYFNGTFGVCQVSDLAATIRDFDSASSPDFESPSVPSGQRTGLVQSTLGTDGTPSQSTAGAQYFLRFAQWFHDVPGVNSTTCIDIPLSLNAQGLYTHYDSTYFPIDTFQNPHNNLITQPNDTRYRAKEDGKLHNFSFCMESHAQFTYQPGQTFTFSGDDDVWVFINKQLVIDLGGIHQELTSSVNLTNLATQLGLVTGQTYPWDFFFCERHTTQSHLRISTDLNLQTRTAFSVEKRSDIAAGTVVFTIHGLRPGQGCARDSRFPTIGRFVLSGPGGFATPQTLSGGTSFGGLTVDPSFGSVTIDTSAILGLPAGTYALRTYAGGDSTVFQDFSFTVPLSPIPVFAGSKPPYTGPIGTGLWIPVTELHPDTRLPSGKSIPFVVHAITGLSYCKDSACTQPIAPGDTLMTGIGGNPRLVWVRGDAPGKYGLVIGSTAFDSTDRYANLTFLEGRLRYTDSFWTPYATVPRISQPVRVPRQVWIASFAAGAVCPTCQDTIVLASIFPGLQFLSGPKGPAIDTLVLSGGVGTFWVVSAIPIDSTRFLAKPQIGSDSTAATWTPVTYFAAPPDSGWFLDRNGDGRVDGAEIFLHQPWSTGDVLRLSWPGMGDPLTLFASEISVAADSMSLQIRLGPGRVFAQDLTAMANPADSLGQWAWDATWPMERFRMEDRVAPVPTYARISWAAGPGAFDTLRVASSEPLGPLTESDVIRFLAQGGNWMPGGQASQYVEATRDTLVLLYDPTGSEPAPGDSVRFAPNGGISDVLGNRPGDTAKSVVIQGTDQPPLSAVMLDADADGRADEVVLRFRSPLHSTRALGFLWPDPATGTLGPRRIPYSQLETDSGGRVVVAHLDPPYAFGSTSCPAPGCWGLGWMESSTGGDTAVVRFPVQDGVMPVIVSATLHFAFLDNVPDTFRVVFSEPISADSHPIGAMAPWISWGKPALDSLGAAVPYSTYFTEGDTAIVFLVRVSDTFPIAIGDSVRITAKPQGIVSDTAGNFPGSFAHWTPVVFGPTPLRLQVKPYIPVRTYTGWPIPTDEPNVTLLVRDGPRSPWRLPDGSSSPIDTSHATGVIVHTDRMVFGGFYLYDNIGVFLTSANLGEINKAMENNTIAVDPRGFYDVFFAWNGRANDGRIAPSGVYLVRIFGWKIEGNQKILVNKVQSIGWKAE